MNSFIVMFPSGAVRSVLLGRIGIDIIPSMASAAVITISDSRSVGSAQDSSGPAAVEFLAKLGMTVQAPVIIPDDAAVIRKNIRDLVGKVELIVTSGGTGISPRDVTYEAIAPLLTKELPGFGEIMRTGTFIKTPLSIISRGGAGLVGETVVVMLPGSPKAVKECLELIAPALTHVLKVITGGPMDCQAEAGK